jgi:hypothetical protein
LARAEARDVNVAVEAALLEGGGEGGVVDFVVVEEADEDGEVVVAVWNGVRCVCV